MLKKLGLYIFILLNFQFGISQSYKQHLELINKAIVEDDHYNAVYFIEKALAYEISTDSLRYLAAESARKLNAFAVSESYYRDIINTKMDEENPEILYYLGEVCAKQSKYNDAVSFYNKYLALGDNDTIRTLAKAGLASAQWAKANNNKKDPLIKIQPINSKVNSDQNEMNVTFYKNSLYVTTMRYDENDKKSDPIKKGSRIIKFSEQNQESQDIEKGLIDANSNVAHISFTPDGSRIFFSKCDYLENSTQLTCSIYTKVKLGETWSASKKLNSTINAPNSNNTQPHVTLDPLTGKLKLYFVSDRKLGKGGTDIYSSVFTSEDEVTIPENMETINTIGNEYSPYYNARRNVLYFSSDGYSGFGGLDIFKYFFAPKDSIQILNLGASVNTSYDDLSFSIDSAARNGYLASNRPGSRYIDETLKACCFDLYKVSLIPATIDLEVFTFDAFDSLAINGTTVTVQELDEKGAVIFSQTNEKGSNFNLKITEDKKYRIIATKNGFVSDTIDFSTIDPKDFGKITKNLYLTQIKELNVSTFEKTTNIALRGVKLQVWDKINNKLISELLKTDTNYFSFKILKGTEYQIIASKNKYDSDTLLITPQETANESILNRKMFLELTAIAELRRLLPIKLFFDNDTPNPKSESDTTNVLFSNIYRDYLNKKGIYMYEFTNILSEPQRSKALLDIDTFFDHNVKLNAEKLNLFMDKLVIILEEGHSIDIFLKGYSSPRAKSEYNQHLSSRRVNSIRNEFNRYNNGNFHPFIKGENLKIKEIPFGESQASIDVSDSIEDVRNSVYSLKAAYERRVEILEILKGVDDK